MEKNKSKLHDLLEKSEEKQIYVNVTTELEFAIVQSNIESGVYYDKMLLSNIEYSTEDKEYTSEARRENEGSLRVTQGFSFIFDKNEFASLMPDQHMPVKETADSSTASEAIVENSEGAADADLTSSAAESTIETDSVIAEVVEQGKQKLL
jgi:hypothetical protein